MTPAINLSPGTTKMTIIAGNNNSSDKLSQVTTTQCNTPVSAKPAMKNLQQNQLAYISK
jgi:hypothetical protein